MHFACRHNINSMFAPNGLTWIVDDTNVYRHATYTTPEGNVITKPHNGFVSIFVPATGIVHVKVMPVTFWRHQKRLGQYCRYKAAQAVSYTNISYHSLHFV